MRAEITVGDDVHMASPTARRRRIGGELRRYRIDAGLTQEQAAEQVDMSAAQVGRIETGHMVRLSVHQVRAFLDAYGIEDADVRTEIETWTREARSKGWWAGYRAVLADRFAGLEDAASAIREFNGFVVPGLLQTEAYARAVFAAGYPKADGDELTRRVEARMRRAEILDRDPAPDVWVVVDESVLRRVIGSAKIMTEQLDRLADLARRPGVTIQVLPFSAGAHAAIDGNVLAFEFPEDAPVAVIEDMAGTVYVEDADDVARLLFAHNQVCAAAAAPAESLRMITDARETVRD